MASIFNSMIGAPPPDDSLNQAQLADALRRRERLGAIGVLTGDPAMASQGKILQGGAMDSANLFAQNREHGIDDAQTRRYQDWQQQQAAQNLAEQIRAHKAEEANRVAMLDIYKEKADKMKDASGVSVDPKQVIQLGKQYTSAKMPQVDASIGEMNATLNRYGDSDIPGFGYAKNLPGAALFLSDEGKLNKSKMQAVSNDLLNMYSGLAVTLPESERRALEQMTSGAFSAEDTKRAWPQIVNRYNQVRSSVLGGYSPDVQQAFFDNMPTPSSREPMVPAGGAPLKVRGQEVGHGASGSYAPTPSSGGWGPARVKK